MIFGKKEKPKLEQPHEVVAISQSLLDTKPAGLNDVSVSMDEPFSEDEFRSLYKSYRHVMGRQKIRKLIHLHKQAGAGSNVKMTILFGLALSLQVLAVLLIFI